MTYNWRTYECSTKFCSYVTTGTVCQIALSCRGYSQPFAWGNAFSLVTNGSLKLKMNICILELSILFPKNLLFLYYIQVIRFGFFWEKSKSVFLYMFYCFILPWICPWFHDDTKSYVIHNSFFSKNRESYHHRPISSFHFFRLKAKLFSRFYQKQTMQKGVKIFC